MNIFCDTSVGKALSGSLRDDCDADRCNGPGMGRADAPVPRRVGEDDRVRAGVPGTETYHTNRRRLVLLTTMNNFKKKHTTLTYSSSESSESTAWLCGFLGEILTLSRRFSIEVEAVVWDRRTSCRRLMVVRVRGVFLANDISSPHPRTHK